MALENPSENGKPALPDRNLRPEGKAPDPALEAVADREASGAVGARRAKGLPLPEVVHEQFDDHAVRGDRPPHPAAEADRPRRGRASRRDPQRHARAHAAPDPSNIDEALMIQLSKRDILMFIMSVATVQPELIGHVAEEAELS